MRDDLKRFQDLSFEGFRELAKDDSLNCYEKIGFPTDYRKGKEEDIFKDIRAKLPLLNDTRRCIIDIGPGCSKLATMLVDLCEEKGHTLIFVDSEEMLDLVPDKPFLRKVAGCFPSETAEQLEPYKGKVDVFLSYSVMHYVMVEGNWFDFLDRSMALLNWGGQALLGDLPNYTMRQRFFNSPNGVKYHQSYTKSDSQPDIEWSPHTHEKSIDDSVILASLMRLREAGCHGYVVPQAANLPMANRREDILFFRP
jgi:hypothetical protein